MIVRENKWNIRKQNIKCYVESHIGGVTTYGLYDIIKNWNIKIMYTLHITCIIVSQVKVSVDINGHLHYGLLLFMLAVANLADNLIVGMYSLDTVV